MNSLHRLHSVYFAAQKRIFYAKSTRVSSRRSSASICRMASRLSLIHISRFGFCASRSREVLNQAAPDSMLAFVNLVMAAVAGGSGGDGGGDLNAGDVYKRQVQAMQRVHGFFVKCAGDVQKCADSAKKTKKP